MAETPNGFAAMVDNGVYDDRSDPMKSIDRYTSYGGRI